MQTGIRQILFFLLQTVSNNPDVSLGINYVINLSKVVNYYVQSSNLVIQLSDQILTIVV